MHTVTSHSIPKLFSGYAVVLGSESNGTTGNKPSAYVQHTRYHCHYCNTDFTVDHQWHGGLYYGGQGFGDFIIYCPFCGHRHENFTRRHQIYTFEDIKTETAPLKMEISLMEYKQGFILRTKADTLTIKQGTDNNGEQRLVNHFGKCTEEIRFDIAARRTLFTVMTGSRHAKIKEFGIGDPFDVSLYQGSLLLQVQSDNLSEEVRNGTVALVKTLRDSVRRKWKELHGYDIGSLFVSYGTVNGRMLFPIMNIAFRLKFPDAPNLPGDWNTGATSIKALAGRRMINEEMAARYAVASLEKKTDSVTALIGAFGLPDKPMVRKILTADFFAAPELVQLFKITENLDLAAKVWDKMREYEKPVEGYFYTERKDLAAMYPFLQELAAHYPARSVVAFFRRKDWSYIRDIKSMLGQLHKERHGDAWKVKLKELHDWLVMALKDQKEKGFALETPEYIKRRLAMQTESLKFFLPKHTSDLVEASDKLHNCVRTYADRVYNGECNIVLMTDDIGMLVACLEVKNGVLVQAKLKHNRSVRQDAKINKAVVEWCGKANLKIETDDVLTADELKLAIVTAPEEEERMAAI